MGIKTKLAMAVVTSAAGAAMIAGGTFALFTSSSTNSGNTFTAGTVKVDASKAGVWSGAQYIGNLAPGDSEQGTLTVTNSGSLDEWVKVSNAGSGDLFSGANPVTVTSTDAQVFKLAAGASVTLHYTYIMPSAAGNEYQGKTGSVDFTVNAVQARNNELADHSGPVAWN